MRGIKILEMPSPCCWWVLCANEATKTLEHPVLGDVPICDRCINKIKEIENADPD